MPPLLLSRLIGRECWSVPVTGTPISLQLQQLVGQYSSRFYQLRGQATPIWTCFGQISRNNTRTLFLAEFSTTLGGRRSKDGGDWGVSFTTGSKSLLPRDISSVSQQLKKMAAISNDQRSAKQGMLRSRSDGPLADFWKVFNSDKHAVDKLFATYSRLPAPRLRYLSQEQVYRLLFKLSDVEKRNEKAILYYLTVIDDMKNGKVPIPRIYWNIAMSLVHKCYQKPTEHDAHSGLFLWKEMEKVSGVPADVTTFNVLFHLATNSGMAHLPLTILKEMKRREIQFDRFSYVNLMIYHGRQGNNAGIRRAYRDFVEAGQIVDIVVLNAAMTALIKAGEPQAAEDILAQLKRPSLKTYQNFAQDKRKLRRLNKNLKELNAILKRQGFGSHPSLLHTPPTPDLISFAIFIDHHATETADFGKILAILHDLAECGIHPETSIYQSLFKGFALHGNVKFTPWTLRKLDAVFEAFLDGRYLVSRDAAGWCLRSYSLLAGKERSEEIWQAIKERWIEQGGDPFDIWDIEDNLPGRASR